MAIEMVRKPSETPNISNIDDIIPMRYAYGNQDGFVIGRGSEIGHTITGSSFVVNSGRLVLQGVESDIDANGVTIAVDNISTKRYYVVYYEVNLATNSANILSEYDIAAYPNIDTGDDLTENTSGTAKLPIYKFEAQSGVISNIEKIVKAIKYVEDRTVDNANKVQNVDLSEDSVAQFGGYIVEKRKLLFSNSSGESNPTSIVLSESVKKGDIIEIYLGFNDDAPTMFRVIVSSASVYLSNSHVYPVTNWSYSTSSVNIRLFLSDGVYTEIRFSERGSFILLKDGTTTTETPRMKVYQISKIL